MGEYIPVKFTSTQVSACKVTYINKKTNADGSHLGFSCGLIDGDWNHYSFLLKDVDASADKATVKTALKAYLLTIDKTPPHEPISSSSLLSEDDANESLS